MPIFEVEIYTSISPTTTLEKLHTLDREQKPWGSYKYPVVAKNIVEAKEKGLDIYHSTVPIKVLENFDITTYAFKLARVLTIHDVDEFLEAMAFAKETGDAAGFLETFTRAIRPGGAMDKSDMYPDRNEGNKSFYLNHWSSVQKKNVEKEGEELKLKVKMGEMSQSEANKRSKDLKVQYYSMGLELHGYGRSLSVSLDSRSTPYYSIHT